MGLYLDATINKRMTNNQGSSFKELPYGAKEEKSMAVSMTIKIQAFVHILACKIARNIKDFCIDFTKNQSQLIFFARPLHLEHVMQYQPNTILWFTSISKIVEKSLTRSCHLSPIPARCSSGNMLRVLGMHVLRSKYLQMHVQLVICNSYL